MHFSPRDLVFPPHPESVFDRGVGVLRNASHASGVAAGNVARTTGPAWPNAIPNADDPYDVRPRELSLRPITLSADSDLSTGIALFFSTDRRSESRPESESTREFSALIEWGTGNARHAVEVDIAEGTCISVHAQSVDVKIFDYSMQPTQGAPYWRVEQAGSCGYLPTSKPGVKTQRVYAPVLFGTDGEESLPVESQRMMLSRANASVFGVGPFVTSVQPSRVEVSEGETLLQLMGGRLGGLVSMRLVGREGIDVIVGTIRRLDDRRLEAWVRALRAGVYTIELLYRVLTSDGPQEREVRFPNALVVEGGPGDE